MNNSMVIKWVQENLQRLFTKSPLFFRIWSIISSILVLITGLPDFIDWLNVGGIKIPNLWDQQITLGVAWASRGMLLMSILTTQKKTEGITTDGTVLIATNVSKLPFTAEREKKIAVKKGVDVLEVNTL